MEKIRVIYIFIFLFLCACAVPHAPVYMKNGKEYGVVSGNFTNQWYDYYERAFSYMDGEFYSEALSDLNIAIKKKPAEKRWANTYGMHFMDYFPHRKTGIIHYSLGNYDAAKTELEVSIEQEPSAKARFYLDEVRKQIMLRERKDKSKPHLILEYPRLTKDDPVTISGIAKDERFVSEIILSGKKIFIEASEQHVAFKKDLPLAQGRHEITIIARNLLEGEEKHAIVIHVDRSGPVIIIKKFDPGIEIQGYLYDESEIQSFSINGDQKDIPVKDEVFKISLKPGVRSVALKASDKLGNETRANVISDMMTENRFLLLATAEPGLQSLSNSVDEPGIMLKGWPEIETVFRKSVDIEGQVKGKSNISELTIQVKSESREYPAVNKMQGKAGPIISFNQSVRLDKGKNTIIIRAKDEAGNKIIRKIFIIRRIARVFQLKYRYIVKICPFDNTEWKRNLGFFQRVLIPVFSNRSHFMEPEKLAWFQHSLSGNLRNQNRFQVMEQKELQRYFDEYNLEKITVESSEQNNLMIPHALLLGNTCVDRNGVEISARLINLKTFEEIATIDVYNKSGGRSALKFMAEELSEKFHITFPLANGKITNTEKMIQAVFENGKIKQGWPIIAYREEHPRHNPETGMSLGSDTVIIGDASMGKNEVIFVNDHKFEIKKGDRVINR